MKASPCKWKAFCWLVCNCENARTKSTVVSQVSPRAKLSDTFAPNEEKSYRLKSRLKLSLSVKECLCRTGSGA